MSSPPPPVSTTLTIDQLRLSRFNVRINQDDARPTAPLKASIAAGGVEQSLSVHPLRGNKKLWGVLAGGRRFRCVRELVDEGLLPAAYPVPVLIHDVDDGEIVALSLDENIQRLDLRSYEICAAIVRENKLGKSAREIADRHGQALLWAERGLRLGTLAPRLFQAFAEGIVSTDQAQAYAATADHDIQLAAFDAMMARPEPGRTPNAIRAWLRVDDQEASKLLAFAGDEYRAAGGAFEVDLFDDGLDDSGRVTDEPLLRRVAEAKLDALRVATRERMERPELRFVTVPPPGVYGGADWSLHIGQVPGPDGDGSLPAGDVVAHIEILDDGTADVTFWWASRKARDGVTPPRAAPAARPNGRVKAGAAIGQQYDNSRQLADALIKEEAGLTAEGTQILRSLRRAILRAGIVQDARDGRTLGRDLLVFSQARMLLAIDSIYPPRENEVGMKRLSSIDADSEAARNLIDDSEAGKAWVKAIRELKGQSFLTEPDHGLALLAFRNAPPTIRDLAAAVVAGIALERSLHAYHYRVALHDVLAVQAKVAHPLGMRRWWRPTAAFLKLLPRAEQLAIAEPFVERAVFATWGRLKVDELTPLVLKVVTGGAASVRRTLAAAAAEWVHPLLRFAQADRTLAEVYADHAADQGADELEDAA